MSRGSVVYSAIWSMPADFMVALLPLGVEQNEVEWSGQRRDGVQRRPDPHRDAIGMLAGRDVLARDGGVELAELTGGDVPAWRECLGHGQRRIAGERAHLENRLRAQR